MNNVYFPSPSGPSPQGVFVLDPTTGLPSALGGGGGGGGGDASAANQVSQTVVLEAIRDRLPATTLVLTPTVVVATGAGTAAAGARVLGFAVTGAGAATIAGATVPSGTSFDFTAPLNSTLAAVDYNATGTTLVVTRLS